MSSDLLILGEVAIAMLLGGVIGAERELADKPAGLRTHMLIAGAAALLVGLADAMIHRFTAAGEAIRSDPLRVIEAVVTAVGFLGAGMILRRGDGEHVEGLTTAASVLFAAAVGVCVALQEFLLAAGVTLLDLATLRGAKVIETRIRRARRARSTTAA
ncbi:MAG TPA: MgtC/SapB family protein [Thermoanaerobaculia bacterium]|jgi:putative Mg2+ transporter-C (MgtC) family protein|nr:MgtC/SapB family protein [Thermoanaerobaculia bacterium]